MADTIPVLHNDGGEQAVVHSVRMMPATAKDAVKQQRQQCCGNRQGTKHEITLRQTGAIGPEECIVADSMPQEQLLARSQPNCDDTLQFYRNGFIS